MVVKVGGQVAANFSIHKSLLILMLKHDWKVGGQVFHTHRAELCHATKTKRFVKGGRRIA